MNASKRNLGRVAVLGVLMAVPASCMLVTAPSDFTVVADAGKGDAVVISLPDATSGHDSTSGQDATGPVTCGEGLPTTDEFNKIVTACTIAVSCNYPYFYNVNISECISIDFLQEYPSRGCLFNATSCNAASDCTGQRNTTPSDCPGGTGTGGSNSCNGNNEAVDCEDLVVYSCPSGETCALEGSTGVAYCSASFTCDETSTTSSYCGTGAYKDYLYTCFDGVPFGQDCSASAAHCGTIAGDTSCYADIPVCATAGYSCSGNTLTFCEPTIQNGAPGLGSVTTDCGALGSTCVASKDGSSGFCEAPGCTQNDVNSCVESCVNGTTMSLCVGGAPYHVDCTTLGAGFTQCATATDMSDTPALVYAFCN